MQAEQVVNILKKGDFPGILEVVIDRGDAVVRLDLDAFLGFFQNIKERSALQMDMLLSLTAVDWLDRPNVKERFEAVYHLRSIVTGAQLRVKVWLPESRPEVPSLSSLWRSADFMEREVWDMYGIQFTGHPDLRRILMYEEFKGHPLRKDYPLQGKQPRVTLRYPEVRNTAMDMRRPDLVQIRRVGRTA